jgi:hypothetical protein
VRRTQLYNAILLGISIMLLAACSAEPTPVATPSPTPEMVEATPEGTPETTPEDEPEDEPQAAGLLLDLPGLQEIALTTPQEGVGPKPQFAWQPVEGAARYVLVVYTAEREPYWAWEGSANTVYLGGGASAPAPDSAGPVLVTDMAWAVMALDADNRLIGSSVLRPIAP